MAQPICIITAGGVKCAASKVKQHFPDGWECKVISKQSQANVRKQLKAWRKQKLASKPDVFTRVVEIMLAAGVKDDTPFTIVMAPKP